MSLSIALHANIFHLMPDTRGKSVSSYAQTPFASHILNIVYRSHTYNGHQS